MKRALKHYPGLYREDYKKRGKSRIRRYRIVISRNKKTIQEYFYIGKDEKAKDVKHLAVKRWREIREEYPVIDSRGFREVVRGKSSSGVAGVRRVTKTVKGKEYLFWCANWTDAEGKRKTKSFSCNKHGKIIAKRLAIKARKEALDLICV